MIGIAVIVAVYVACSLLLLVYGLQCYVLTFLYLRKRTEKLAYHHDKMSHFEGITDESKYPKVVTQLPMYNEKYVAIRVIEAVAKMDYPVSRHEIQVIDDSTDETVGMVDECVARLKASGLNISTVRRTDRVGYKAGALQNATKFTDAEYIAIFDADFVPTPDFLRKAVPFFLERPDLGLVQGRWTHLNPHASLITRAQSMGIDGHFMIEQAARSWNNLFMNFNGTAGMFRRSAIEASGGWQHDTLTEDMDLSYRMQMVGWQAEYVPDIMVPAEIPEDINAFKNQQFRWAKGSIQTAIKIVPMLLEKKVSPFKLMQAIFHLTHYVVHPLMFIMALLTMPMLYFIGPLVDLSPALYTMMLVSMLLASSGPTFLYMVAQHMLGNQVRKKMWLVPMQMVIGTGLAVNNAKAVLEAVLGKESAFIRTPKKGEKKVISYAAVKDITNIIELALGFYCLFTLYMFFGYTNFLVTPFIVIYASGFLFTGTMSILHFRNPGLVDAQVPSFGLARQKSNS